MSAPAPERTKARGAPALVGIFVLLVAGVGLAGYLSYHSYMRRLRVATERQLSAVADLKVSQLVRWRRERLGDGRLLAADTDFSGRVRRWDRAPNDAATRAAIWTRLGSLQAAHDYERVVLVDAQGLPRMSVPETPEPVDPRLAQDVPEAIRSGRVSLVDFRRDTPDGPVHLAVLVPILDALDKRGLGAVVLRIDPEEYLYPFMQWWPTPDETSETLLVRREGGDVLFLNDLRFEKNAALRLSRPLTTTSLPASRAALGQEGIMEGVDYRGSPTVAALRTVPESPWFLVARMDTKEAYAPLRQRLWETVAFLALLLLGAGAGVGLVRRQQELRSIRGRLEEAEKLRAALRLIEDVVNVMPVRVFWKDNNLVYLGCNAAFARDAGFADAKDIIGKEDCQMAWRDEAEAYRADDRQIIESGCSKLLIEESQTTPTGNTIALLTNKIPLRSPAGEVIGVLGTYIEITERKQAEEALRASEARYRRLFESAHDGILILHAETGMVVDVNPFLVELLGFSREELLGKKVWELGVFNDALSDEASLAALNEKGYLRYENVTLETKDGRRVDVELVSTVYQVSHDNVVQCNLRDISARVRAAESHARLATAVEQAAEAIVITDPVGSILYVNPAFERSSGYSRDEALGQNPRILKSGKHDGDFYAELWTVLRRGDVWSGHFINKRKDGTLFEEEATISPVRNTAGQVVNYVAVKRDVTNEMQLAQQLFQAQKMEAVGRLAGGVAHDFNNLLAVIVGYGEIVGRRLPDGDPLREKVEQILRAADRAAGLTRQLLAFSRKQVLQPRILDLNLVVSDFAKMLPRVIGEDVELATRLAADPGSVKADPGQIEQVLMNLAVNARDAMPQGGQIIIETRRADIDASYAATRRLAPTGQYVMLAVSDTGSGMDAATQARIFEPFFSTKEVGKGTGLGLSTVFGIVKQSGGYIWVYSEVGVGTTFKILLPRVDEEALHICHDDQGPLLTGSETVLLVEDEESLRQLLLETLETSGYSVLVAQDGTQALRIAAAHPGPIEIMVTDVIMPGMTGPTLVAAMAQPRPGMKAVFMSGYSEEAVAKHGMEGPGRAFISKPFGPETLLRQIRDLLDADR